jgi:hypothetical protein
MPRRRTPLFPIALTRQSLSVALDGVSLKQIDASIASGALPAYRMPGVAGVRIAVSDAIDWLRSHLRFIPNKRS